jgi:hypothetical protein
MDGVRDIDYKGPFSLERHHGVLQGAVTVPSKPVCGQRLTTLYGPERRRFYLAVARSADQDGTATCLPLSSRAIERLAIFMLDLVETRVGTPISARSSRDIKPNRYSLILRAVTEMR